MSDKVITSYRLRVSGGSISAPSRSKLLQPELQDEAIVVHLLQDQPLSAAAFDVTSPIVAWNVSVVCDGESISETSHYCGSINGGAKTLHIFIGRV